MVIKGTDVAKQMTETLRLEVMELKEKEIIPCAVIVRVGENSSCIAYSKSAVRKMASIGVSMQETVFPENIAQEDFIEEFRKINNDPKVHGILLMRPLPAHLDEKAICAELKPSKDVDAISPVNMYKALSGDSTAFLPCTPEAVMDIVDYLGIDLTGKKIAIVGASKVVGMPLFLLMLNRNATCVQCHIHTKDLAKECRDAEIIVVAAGKRGLIGAEHIAPGATVIDVGTNVGEDGKVYGDVSFEEVAPKAAYITPSPGGVGTVTSTVLASHIIKAARMLHAV